MATTELKRYAIRPDGWGGFLEVIRRIAVVRRRHGFGILFALADRETNMFTWAIDHEGDFDVAAKNYYEDPERVELEVVGEFVLSYEIRKVETVDL